MRPSTSTRSMTTARRARWPGHPGSHAGLARLATAVVWVVLVACGGDGDGANGTAADAPISDRGKPADGVYTRDLTFLAGEGRRALVFVSRAVLRDGAASLQSAAWADAGGGWDRAFAGSREFAELRDPWRIVPLGPLRLSVEDDGALRALVVPSSVGELRLVPATPPTELASGANRISMRGATLLTPDDSIQGVLIDGMLAVATTDSAGPALIGVLTSSGGPIVVLAAGEGGTPVLIADVGGEELFRSEIRLEPGTSRGEWRIVSADTSVAGTLQAADPAGAAEPADGTAERAPISVAGRLALAGTLYPLAGGLRGPTP
jgi:hypothetical protein